MAPSTLNPIKALKKYRVDRQINTVKQITQNAYALIEMAGGWDALDIDDQQVIWRYQKNLVEIGSSLQHHRSLNMGRRGLREATALHSTVKNITDAMMNRPIVSQPPSSRRRNSMVEFMPMSEVAVYVDVIDNEGALKGVNEESSSRHSHDTSITLEDSSLNTYRSSQDRHPLAGTGLRFFPNRSAQPSNPPPRPPSPPHDKADLSQCRTPKETLSAYYGVPMSSFVATPMQSESSLALGYYQEALYDTVDVQPHSQPLRGPSRKSTQDTIQASTMRFLLRTPPSRRSTLGTVNVKW